MKGAGFCLLYQGFYYIKVYYIKARVYLLLFSNCVKYWFLVFDFHEIFCSPSCITMSEINTPLPSRRPTTLSPRPLPGFLLRSTWRSWYKSVPSFFRSMIIFTAFSLVNRSVCRASLWVQSLKALPSTEIIKSPGLIRPSLSAAPSLWTSWTITPPWWWKKIKNYIITIYFLVLIELKIIFSSTQLIVILAKYTYV